MTGHTSYARAVAGYDETFKRDLSACILHAIAQKSLVTNANVLALRIAESRRALTFVMEMVAGCSAQFDDRDRPHSIAEATARHIERNVAKLRAHPEFAADIFGAPKGGGA
jgi:hypothetical protein